VLLKITPTPNSGEFHRLCVSHFSKHHHHNMASGALPSSSQQQESNTNYEAKYRLYWVITGRRGGEEVSYRYLQQQASSTVPVYASVLPTEVQYQQVSVATMGGSGDSTNDSWFNTAEDAALWIERFGLADKSRYHISTVKLFPEYKPAAASNGLFLAPQQPHSADKVPDEFRIFWVNPKTGLHHRVAVGSQPGCSSIRDPKNGGTYFRSSAEAVLWIEKYGGASFAEYYATSCLLPVSNFSSPMVLGRYTWQVTGPAHCMYAGRAQEQRAEAEDIRMAYQLEQKLTLDSNDSDSEEFDGCDE
jgi:hypothetical protein